MLPTTTIKELRSRLENGTATSHSLVKEAIESLQVSENNATLWIDREEALASAAEIDRRRASGEPLAPLAGIPIVVKANILIKDKVCSAGSKMLENFIPPFDATVVEKLRAAGAIIVAQGNMDEFAAGSTGTLSAFGVVKNPRYPRYVSGGSSSGSAVAIAEGSVAIALGTDTGGSIRLPAACCGIVGLKPTYGAVSRYGVVEHAGSFDQVGPLGSTVADVAQLYDAIVGYDSRDSKSSHFDHPTTANRLGEIKKGLKIGLPQECFDKELDPQLKSLIDTALQKLCAEGAELVTLSLPHFHHTIATYNILSTAEFATATNRYDGVRYGRRAQGAKSIDELFSLSRGEGFGDEVKRRILLGNYALVGNNFATYFEQAQKMRRVILEETERALEMCDIIATPTLRGAPMESATQKSATSLRFNNYYTALANLTGLPALSFPVGAFGEAPASLQLIGNPFDEVTLLQTAARLEALCSG